VRRQHSPQLEWLPTHVACNSRFKSDEEYFVAALVGQHQTVWSEAVLEHLRRGIAKGHGIGLIKSILSQFSRVVGARGERLFQLDTNRANRAIWKIVRGLYTLETGTFLPEDSYLSIEIIPRSEADGALWQHPWYPLVRHTEGVGRHKAIFDYKWMCRYVDDGHVSSRSRIPLPSVPR